MDSSSDIAFYITVVAGLLLIAFGHVVRTEFQQNYQEIETIASNKLLEDLNPETVLEGREYLNISGFSEVNFMDYQKFKSHFSWEENKTIIYSGSNLAFFKTEHNIYYGYKIQIERKGHRLLNDFRWMNPINQEIIEIG